MESKKARSEQVVFDDLAKLCVSTGYVHAIACLCLRDNIIGYSDEMKAEDMQHLFTKSRLIRTEISTLIGLMLKGNIDYSLPAPKIIDCYIKKTEALLEELHQTMLSSPLASIDSAKIPEKDFNPFTSGVVLREAIFYSVESAYSFQYRDFSLTKYKRDDKWLLTTKGFSIQYARKVVCAISQLQGNKAVDTLQSMRKAAPDDWTCLPFFTFTIQEVADLAGMHLDEVKSVLNAFSVPAETRNEQFKSLHDFNIINAYPLIHMQDGEYVLFHNYSLVEALYEAPFYWMGADKVYVRTAMKNRGLFTEEFAIERLEKVFGTDNVFCNIDIFESKSKKLGEIDVLVLFGDRALVLQAKSKRLTLEARRGNDCQIQNDFKKSIQDSSDQAYDCAKQLEEGKCEFRNASGSTLTLPKKLKRIYVLCLIADHYPALSFQTRQFIKCKPTATISAPFVMDVFALDAMTEMLESPLQLLSYIDRRTGYNDKLMASHELTILSYHLKKNLWFEGDYDLVMMEDDIAADLDLAMLVRREGVSGKRTPDGILTQFTGTVLGQMLKAIEVSPEPAIIDFGLTVSCTNDTFDVARLSLKKHCYQRKYKQKVNVWFGVCVSPTDSTLSFGVNLNFPWQQNDEMDETTKNMKNMFFV